MTRRQVVGLGLVLPLAALTGCGGGSNPPPNTTEDQLLATAQGQLPIASRKDEVTKANSGVLDGGYHFEFTRFDAKTPPGASFTVKGATFRILTDAGVERFKISVGYRRSGKVISFTFFDDKERFDTSEAGGALIKTFAIFLKKRYPSLSKEDSELLASNLLAVFFVIFILLRSVKLPHEKEAENTAQGRMWPEGYRVPEGYWASVVPGHSK